MNHKISIYGRVTFATAIHRMAELMVLRWAITHGYGEQMFPDGPVMQLDMPKCVGLKMISAIDYNIKQLNASVTSEQHVCDSIIISGVDAGIEAIVKNYSKELPGLLIE